MFLTRQQVLNISQVDLPLMVLSDNVRSWVAARIKALQNGFWNHYMWMHKPKCVATQDATFRERPIEDYLGYHRLKFWRNPNWTDYEKRLILEAINDGLDEPWYRRCYDPLQILGIRLGARWLQIPGSSRICSDHAEYLAHVDGGYNLKHPSPPEINRWLKSKARYEVYGRYSPDRRNS